ncbi:unnamed protein product [Medioppia subpectinata]|uniref:POU domain protein n=1 Tax=Medioppia subpectinata TaxID=1979941 RepID=A0A7R9PX10_9ACAR|nr:unnamed protein product [Medioppia subpectinata]CAG2104336.1 unnamed protein product [Medioppia subpectinata]
MHFPQTSYASHTAGQQTNGVVSGGTHVMAIPQQQIMTAANGISYIASPSATGVQQQQQIISTSGALTPQLLQQLQQHLCSQNVMTAQPTTQYVISTQGSAAGAGTAIAGIPHGYQAVQTVGGQQVLIQTNAALSQQMSANGVSVQTAANASANQMVQLVLSNGQVITTTLANLQAMGVTAPSPQINATQTPQQYSTQYQTSNGNIIVTGAQPSAPSIPLQTQIVTNSAGQMFAITPQIAGQPIQQPMIAQQTAPNGTTQYIQITAQPYVQQMAQQMVAQQPQVMANTAALVQQHQQQEDHNKLVAQQQLIQQQLLLQQKQQSEQQNIKSSESQTQTRASSSPSNVSTTQIIVSSTTSRPQSLDNSATVQENTSHSLENTTDIAAGDKVSVQSQTSSPSSSSNHMEAESTTHCNLPNKDTISNTEANIVDGINLEEIKDFAKAFKIRRLSLGLTQTQVGQALSATEGPSYSQSAICRFEKLDITPKSAQKIKPVLENWMKEAEERYKNGNQTLTEFIGSESSKKRKRRTSFTPNALELLNIFFEKNTHPTGSEMTELSEQLNYEREVVRVWFCNKRQALRNTSKKFETNYHQIG